MYLLIFARQLSLTILCDAIVSYYLALLVQASHVFVNSSWPLPDENGYIYADWYSFLCEERNLHSLIYTVLFEVGDASSNNTGLFN